MKRIIYFILACGLTLMMSACGDQGKGDTPTAVKAQLAAVVERSETIQTMFRPDQEKVMDLFVQSVTVMATDNLIISLKADPTAVAVYNQLHPGTNAMMLPNTAYVLPEQLLLPMGQKSTGAQLKLINSGLMENTKEEPDKYIYVLPVAISSVIGNNWELAENSTAFVTVKYLPKEQDGSPENPFLIETLEDLTDMYGLLKRGSKMYFRLENDIDMEPLKRWDEESKDYQTSWIPLNYGDGEEVFTKAIDFDGNGHTISNFYSNYYRYASFFGVLVGYCHDVTFLNAEVKTSADSGCGILGGYAGTGDLHADVARVHVQGKSIFSGKKTGIGGMFGKLGNASLYACSADVEVVSGDNYVGGLYGLSKNKSKVVDCWTSGSVTGNQRVGGIAGGTDKSDTGAEIINCYSTAVVHGSFALGGIGGYFNKDQGSSVDPATVFPDDHFENCIAWNAEIKCKALTPGDVAHYSSGAVVGYTSPNNYLKDCVRNPAMQYNEAIFFDYTDAFSLYNQENASPSTPLVFVPVEGANYNYPYHGKAAAAGKTLSQVAQELGWDPAVWSFSQSYPTLRPDAPVGPVEDVTSLGQLPGFGNNDIK